MSRSFATSPGVSPTSPSVDASSKPPPRRDAVGHRASAAKRRTARSAACRNVRAVRCAMTVDCLGRVGASDGSARPAVGPQSLDLLVGQRPRVRQGRVVWKLGGERAVRRVARLRDGNQPVLDPPLGGSMALRRLFLRQPQGSPCRRLPPRRPGPDRCARGLPADRLAARRRPKLVDRHCRCGLHGKLHHVKCVILRLAGLAPGRCPAPSTGGRNFTELVASVAYTSSV
jgi:hypothetical protein